MGIYNIIGTKDEKFIKNILNKIIFFNTKKEYFNYILVKGSKTHLDLEVEDIIIIQQLMIELARKNKLEVPWLYDANAFIKKVSEARYWADYQKDKLLFGYKPDEEIKTAYSNFCQKLNIYKTKAMNNIIADNEYNQLLQSFFELVIHL